MGRGQCGGGARRRRGVGGGRARGPNCGGSGGVQRRCAWRWGGSVGGSLRGSISVYGACVLVRHWVVDQADVHVELVAVELGRRACHGGGALGALGGVGLAVLGPAVARRHGIDQGVADAHHAESVPG